MSDKLIQSLIVDADKNRLIEAEAARAVEELQHRGAMLTPTLIKGVIEKRLRSFLGPGVVLPKVNVGLRRIEFGGGFDIHITPADIDGIIVKEQKR